MRFRVIATSGCQGGSCPTVYAAEELRGDVYVQGFEVDADTAERLGVPVGESVVRVPLHVLKEAAGE